MEDLNYFVGRWEAEITNPVSGQKLRLTYVVEPTLDGRWLAGFGTSPDVPVTTRDMWGHDDVSGEIVRAMFDSEGTHGIIRAAGWKGPTLVLEGEANTRRGIVRVRETISRVSDDEFRAEWEAFQDGSWTTYSVERLLRAG